MTFGKKKMKKTRHETKEEREQDVTKKPMKIICSARNFYSLFA